MPLLEFPHIIFLPVVCWSGKMNWKKFQMLNYHIFEIYLMVFFHLNFYKIGFIIIPIATTISSWLNALVLLIYIINKEYFLIKFEFIKSFLKIVLSTILTSVIFYNLINYFRDNLSYSSEYKLITIVLLVIVTFVIYIFISILTKAFKTTDIKLKY